MLQGQFSLHDFRREIRPMWQLAWPVILAEMGWMAMGVVDTMMIGRVSVEAMGGVSIGHTIFFIASIFGMGMLLGLDFMVARAVGAGNHHAAYRAFVQGVYLCIAMTVVLTPLMFVILNGARWMGVQDAVLAEIVPYLNVLAWSLFPVLLFAAVRRYLQAVEVVRPILFAMVSANIVNVIADWALIFGHLGFSPGGTEGAAWATSISRVYMCLVVCGYLLWHVLRQRPELWQSSLRPHLQSLRELLRLGTPSALQVSLEMGVFGTVTMIAGTLSPSSLAAHQVVLTIASFTFMMPLGISSAVAVRVGHAVGRVDAAGAGRAGWTGLWLGGGLMIGAGLILVVFPQPLIQTFTTQHTVIATAASLIVIAALFQLFDGLQVVAAGALRGTGDTRTPLLCNLVGHWMVGLPVGWTLCFVRGWDIAGLWVGLCVGLVVVATVLVGIWGRAALNPMRV